MEMQKQNEADLERVWRNLIEILIQAQTIEENVIERNKEIKNFKNGITN